MFERKQLPVFGLSILAGMIAALAVVLKDGALWLMLPTYALSGAVVLGLFSLLPQEAPCRRPQPPR